MTETTLPALVDTMGPVETITVAGVELPVAMHEGQAYFSPRHVCDGLGIAWPPQFTKIKADPVLSACVTNIVTPSQGGPQQTTMLRKDMAPLWLATIKKVAPELQARLNLFRLECAVALDAWFNKGLRNDARVADQYGIPKSRAALYRALAEAEEEKERQALVLAQQAPKVALADAVGAKEITLRKFGASLKGVHINNLSGVLCSMGYLFREGSNLRPYSKYRDKLFSEKQQTYVVGGKEVAHATVTLTAAGMDELVRLYRAGMLPMKKGFADAYLDNREAAPEAA